MTMKYKILILTVFSLILSSQSLLAQDKTTGNDFSAGSDITFSTDKETQNKDTLTGGHQPQNIEDGIEVTIVEDEFAGQYTKASVENISKLYWKKNALSLKNDTAIDNFLLINECDIYQKFFGDDFEWQRVRKAARNMLEERKDSFSEKFKITIPIDLGRYDMEKKGFPLINKTAFKDLRRVEIGGNNDSAPICGKEGAIQYYPRNLILVLSKPFNYNFLNLDEHMAQAFIIRQKYNQIERPDELKNKEFDRLAFARIRIKFSEFQGTTRGADLQPLGIMFGKLDGIDIFEDANEKRLLKSVSF